MTRTTLIGFTGRAGAGKDTAAGALGKGWEIVKFAGALKAMTGALLRYQGCDPKDIARMIDGDLKESPVDELGFRTPRHAMQTLGTEWGRQQMASNFWLDIASRKIWAALTAGRHVAVTDVRFENEAELIRAMGGRVVRIASDRTDAMPVAHVSEKPLPADLEIRNDYTPQFAKNVRYILLGAIDARSQMHT